MFGGSVFGIERSVDARIDRQGSTLDDHYLSEDDITSLVITQGRIDDI